MVKDCGRHEASESARRSMITCLRDFRMGQKDGFKFLTFCILIQIGVKKQICSNNPSLRLEMCHGIIWSQAMFAFARLFPS